MIYDVRQVTTYHYDTTVTDAHHALRLTPIDRPGQRVHAAALDVTPTPIERREGRDFFGNRITWIKLEQQHDVLSVRVAARIAVEEPVRPESTPAWEEVRAAAVHCADFGARAPAHFLFASRVVSLDPEIRDYVASSFPAGRPVLEGAVDLMTRIKTDFVYEVGATTAATTPPMSFALRRGVCQDFSHVMISGLRSLGLPAAYVSGYLRTVQKADEVKLEGADAMHAWVSAWCGARTGWVEYDPTNAVQASSDHIVVARGRDYSDVAPVKGVLWTAGTQTADQAVDVIPLG